ncbi:hypothetical protein [Chryseobacterium sp.]|uniref:hypothetical protein n=1 Tax=Chryseobacterium sp. TaxID=1871047 RepID=UPI000EEEC0A4|nr:hypothetical protein [Chryseobacterium sp.]HCM34138.1 hypothetical protein [Chryseobacterium sp.]
MKKFFLFFILLSGLVFGQECKCDSNFIKYFNEIKEDKIKSFSDDIISGFEKEQKYIKILSNESGLLKVIYYDKDIPDTIVKNDIESGFCSLCTEVIFQKYFRGRNSDLNIKGEEYFNFISVEGKYLDLYKWWQKHFYPNLSKEEILFTDKTHYIKIDEPRINIRFTKTLDTWEIFNKF